MPFDHYMMLHRVGRQIYKVSPRIPAIPGIIFLEKNPALVIVTRGVKHAALFLEMSIVYLRPP